MTLAESLVRHNLDWIVPDWPAPPNIGALMTTRNAEVEAGVRRSMNLARPTPRDEAEVEQNRTLLRNVTGVDPFWLSQVHGTVARVIDDAESPIEADAAIVTRP